ncbi:unnamed protein product [Rhizophagus irregularis]|nr:unnamed protein product [Rhizophagus irregularis]
MKIFFGNDTLREYAIVVLSRPNSSQMDNPEKMKCIWNIKFTDFVEMLNEKATEIWQQYIANVRQVQEDKKAAKKEYEENLQNERKAAANKKWKDEVRKIEKDYDEKQHKLLVISLATGAFGRSLAYFLTFLYPKTCIFIAVLYTSQGSQPNNEGNFFSRIRNLFY